MAAFETIYGVDFSGAKLAGRNTWVARVEAGKRTRPPYRLAELTCLENLSGTAERGPALAHLVRTIAASDGALRALDFPFGLPVEVMAPGRAGRASSTSSAPGARTPTRPASSACDGRASWAGRCTSAA